MPIQLFFLFGLFALILGYVIGNFVPMLKKKPVAEKKDDIIIETQPETEESARIPQPEATPTPTPNLLDVAHFWRQTETKELTAQIDNQFIKQGKPLTSDQHAMLSLLLLDLGDWVGLEGRIQAVKKLQTEEEESAAEAEDESASTGFNPIEVFKDAITADVYLPPANLSLADQINPILQTMLADSPLGDRGISLMDIEGRGMVVNIGLDMYGTVDEVPDDDIRALIKKAVGVWEKRVTGES